MNHRILRRPRNSTVAVDRSATQGHAKHRCYVLVYRSLVRRLWDIPAAALGRRHAASRGDTSRSILADASRSAARRSYAACKFIQKSGELPK